MASKAYDLKKSIAHTVHETEKALEDNNLILDLSLSVRRESVLNLKPRTASGNAGSGLKKKCIPYRAVRLTLSLFVLYGATDNHVERWHREFIYLSFKNLRATFVKAFLYLDVLRQIYIYIVKLYVIFIFFLKWRRQRMFLKKTL